MKKWKKIILVCVFIFVIIIVINVVLNSNIFVTKYEIDNNKISGEISGYKIVQLTDIHSIRSNSQKDKIVNKVKKQNPDVIFLTGDLVDSDYYSEQDLKYREGKIDVVEGLTIEFVRELVDICDVYYVYGNHEMILLDDPINNKFKVGLEELGVKILNNRIDTINVGDSTINLIGVQDPATLYKDDRYAYLEGNSENKTKIILDDLFSENLIDEDNFTILLAHRPEYLELYSDYKIDLVFSGHTHGGVIRLPFIDGVYAHPQGLFPKYSVGFYEEGGTDMILSVGIGYSKIPVRVFNPPEIVVVTLNG